MSWEQMKTVSRRKKLTNVSKPARGLAAGFRTKEFICDLRDNSLGCSLNMIALGSGKKGKRGFTDRKDNNFEDDFCKRKQRNRSVAREGIGDKELKINQSLTLGDGTKGGFFFPPYLFLSLFSISL